MTLQGDSTVRSESTTTGHLSALETIREDQALGAAWRRAEAALPEGWLFYRLEQSDSATRWTAQASRWRHPRQSDSQGWDFEEATGPTPTAALEALAEKLESL